MLPTGLVLKGFVAKHFWKDFVLAAFWISAPIMKISSIAILGKKSYLWIQYEMHFFYHRVARHRKVTRLRYNIGLVMFVTPFLPNYIFSFMPHLLPDSTLLRYFIIVSADVVFLSSLFVLGGDFWDKLAALFTYTAKARFESPHAHMLHPADGPGAKEEATGKIAAFGQPHDKHHGWNREKKVKPGSSAREQGPDRK